MRNYLVSQENVVARFPNCIPLPPESAPKTCLYNGNRYFKYGEVHLKHDIAWKVKHVFMALGMTFLSIMLVPLAFPEYFKLVSKLWQKGCSGAEKLSLYILNADPQMPNNEIKESVSVPTLNDDSKSNFLEDIPKQAVKVLDFSVVQDAVFITIPELFVSAPLKALEIATDVNPVTSIIPENIVVELEEQASSELVAEQSVTVSVEREGYADLYSEIFGADRESGEGLIEGLLPSEVLRKQNEELRRQNVEQQVLPKDLKVEEVLLIEEVTLTLPASAKKLQNDSSNTAAGNGSTTFTGKGESNPQFLRRASTGNNIGERASDMLRRQKTEGSSSPIAQPSTDFQRANFNSPHQFTALGPVVENRISTSQRGSSSSVSAPTTPARTKKQSEYRPASPLAGKATVSRAGPQQVMLRWVNRCISNYGLDNMTNYKNCWADGKAFYALADILEPGFFDHHKNDSDAVAGIDAALKVLEAHGIPKLIDADDFLLDTQGKSLYTYLIKAHAVIDPKLKSKG